MDPDPEAFPDGWHEEEPLGEASWHPQGESRPRNLGRQGHLRRVHVARSFQSGSLRRAKRHGFPLCCGLTRGASTRQGHPGHVPSPGSETGLLVLPGVRPGFPPSDGRSPSNRSVESCPEALGEGDPLGEAQG